MQIKKITDEQDQRNVSETIPVSTEDLQGELDYFLAEKLIRLMLEKELISEAEFNKIMLLNRESFSPMLGRIMPSIP